MTGSSGHVEDKCPEIYRSAAIGQHLYALIGRKISSIRLYGGNLDEAHECGGMDGGGCIGVGRG
jgi:hypothetical protein